jgi:predicted nucleic acid-binding protein
VSFVLDATVALAWCFGQETGTGPDDGSYAVRVLEALRTQNAVVAPLWTLEVANGLLTAERRGRLRADEAIRATRLLLALPLTLEPVERSRAGAAIFRLARTRALSTYDAAYLELAIRLGLPIATLDRNLRIAAGTEGVELFRPGRTG